MKRKVICKHLDDPTKIQIFEVEGFVPKDVIADAPEGDYMVEDLDQPKPGTFVVNVEKKAARIAAEIARTKIDDVKLQKRLEKARILNGLKGKENLTLVEQQQAVKAWIDIYSDDLVDLLSLITLLNQLKK